MIPPQGKPLGHRPWLIFQMIRDKLSAIRDMFRSRSSAYKQVFKKDDRWATIVLLDLAKFCRAHETTYNKDPRLHAAMEGRKEVWLRIQEQLKLDDEQLFNLHRVKYLPRGGSGGSGE